MPRFHAVACAVLLAITAASVSSIALVPREQRIRSQVEANVITVFEPARILAAFRTDGSEPKLTFNVGLFGADKDAVCDAGMSSIQSRRGALLMPQRSRTPR